MGQDHLEDGVEEVRAGWEALSEKMLRHWNTPQVADADLRRMYLFRQITQTNGDFQRAVQALFRQALTTLGKTFPMDTRLLKSRFLDGLSPVAAAQQLGMAESTLFRNQRLAIKRLADVLLQEELIARRMRLAEVDRRLGRSTAPRLFGIDEHIANLLGVLAAPAEPWLVCIEGIGGIGKTTLAHVLMRAAVGRVAFFDFAWVSARPHGLRLEDVTPALASASRPNDDLLEMLGQQLHSDDNPLPLTQPNQLIDALQVLLRQRPYLIGIDNLETAQDLQTLLPLLRQLAGPTKFLLTSRFSLATEAGVFPFRVPELSEPDVFALLRYEAQQRNYPPLAAAADTDLRQIFAVVGGNPLALRLVVGQTHFHGLGAVLADLRDAQGQTAERLYTYIYWRMWERLNEPARKVLTAIAVASERGAESEFLASLTGYSRGDLSDALDHLIRCNLVDSSGDLNTRRYLIHSLTRSFLHKQIGKWGGSSSN